MMKTLCTLFFFAATAASQLNASVIYQFSVDTNSIAGTAANLDFQFNPGGSSPSMTALIYGLDTNGTYNPASLQLTGDATGAFPAGITLVNTTQYNDAFQAITLGDYLNFLVEFSGPGVDTPTNIGTAFGFSIYDQAGTTPLLTTSIDGTIAGIEIDSLVGVAPWNNNEAVVTVALATAAPEPSSIFLLTIGVGGLAVASARANSRKRLG